MLYFNTKKIKSNLKDKITENLTKSSKSPASIEKSNKQGWGLACIRRGQAPSDKLRSSYLVMSK